jgi:hypothetical protein
MGPNPRRAPVLSLSLSRSLITLFCERRSAVGNVGRSAARYSATAGAELYFAERMRSGSTPPAAQTVGAPA